MLRRFKAEEDINENIYLVKYGEIAIKGKNRYLFEDALLSNIKNSIKRLGKFHIKRSKAEY